MSTGTWKIGDRLKRLRGRSPPSYEFAFDTLPETELEHCLHWECRRERAICHQQTILDEAETLAKAPLSEDEKFRQGLELQSELDAARRASRPWIKLSPKERSSVLSIEQRAVPFSEPIRLASELSRLEKYVLSQPSNRRERLEVIVDWSSSTKRLVSSFEALIERLRKTQGTKANLVQAVEARGRQRTVHECLFRLAVWRCWKAGLSASEALRVLARLLPKFGPDAGTFAKKYASLAREGGKMSV